MKTAQPITRIWRAQLFGLGFRSDQLDGLIELRLCYQRGRMIDGRRP